MARIKISDFYSKIKSYDSNYVSTGHSIRSFLWIKSAGVFTGSSAILDNGDGGTAFVTGLTPSSTALIAGVPGAWSLICPGKGTFEFSTGNIFELSTFITIASGATSTSIARFGFGKHSELAYGTNNTNFQTGFGFEIRNLNVWIYNKYEPGSPIYTDTGISIPSEDYVVQVGIRILPGDIEDTIEYYMNESLIGTNTFQRWSSHMMGPYIEGTNGTNGADLQFRISQISYR